MKRYDSYKDSGIDWIGEIPEDWNIKRIKHTTYVKGRIGWQGLKSEEFREVSDSIVVTGTDFKSGKIDWTSAYQIPIDRYNEDPFIQLKENDLLITKDGTIGKVAIVKNMPKIATLNSGVFVVRPNTEDYIPEFMFWILNSEVFSSFYNYNKSGSTIQHLYQNVFNEFKFTCPPIFEQQLISKFLDAKTFEIETLIQKKKQLIALLKEERTAIINHAVTKGINPKVNLKDSGVEWIGEIPEHWTYVSLKRLVKVKDGTHDTPEYVDNNSQSFPFITTKDIVQNSVSFEKCKYISKEDFMNINKRSDVKKGDIIMPMIGTVGSPIVVETSREFSIKNLALIKSSKFLDMYFLKYFFECRIINDQLKLLTSGGVQNFISLGDLRNIKIPKMSIIEQVNITNYLNNKTFEICSIISKTEKEINLMQEYKTALISEAVTGKIDVREAVLN